MEVTSCATLHKKNDPVFSSTMKGSLVCSQHFQKPIFESWSNAYGDICMLSVSR